METDPILEEVHQMKDDSAREVGYDLHALCERLREAERAHPERMISLQTVKMTRTSAATTKDRSHPQ